MTDGERATLMQVALGAAIIVLVEAVRSALKQKPETSELVLAGDEDAQS